MKQLDINELIELNGGEVNVSLDINELIEQINPIQIFYDFGHDVVYPYIYKPLVNWLTK